MGNVGIYSVGTKSVYQIAQSSKTECFASVSQEGLTRELLAQHSCLYLSWLFAFQSCAGHMHHFVGYLVASYPWKLFCLQLLESSHTLSLSITQPLQLNPTINTGYKRLNKITIKFWHGIANKTHSCKLQLYRLFPPFNNMSLTFLRNYKYFDMNKF